MRYGAYSAANTGKSKTDSSESSTSSTTRRPEKVPVVKTAEEMTERFAKDMEQWLRKMKCSGATGMRLDSFRDIKVS